MPAIGPEPEGQESFKAALPLWVRRYRSCYDGNGVESGMADFSGTYRKIAVAS